MAIYEVRRFTYEAKHPGVEMSRHDTRADADRQFRLDVANDTTTGVAMVRWTSPTRAPAKVKWQDGPALGRYAGRYA